MSHAAYPQAGLVRLQLTRAVQPPVAGEEASAAITKSEVWCSNATGTPRQPQPGRLTASENLTCSRDLGATWRDRLYTRSEGGPRPLSNFRLQAATCWKAGGCFAELQRLRGLATVLPAPCSPGPKRSEVGTLAIGSAGTSPGPPGPGPACRSCSSEAERTFGDVRRTMHSKTTECLESSLHFMHGSGRHRRCLCTDISQKLCKPGICSA